MKSGKRIWAAGALVLLGAAAGRGQLEKWVQHVAAGPLTGIFFRNVPMPGGAIPIRRPPAETRPELTRAIATSPREAMLYRLRAQEAELALDFAAAEADWVRYTQTASDRYAAQIELADFHHRRGRTREEVDDLIAAAREPDDLLRPVVHQRAWRAFERIESLVQQEDLPDAVASPALRAWVARYPKEPESHRRLIRYLTKRGQYAPAEQEIAGYGRIFHDDLFPVKARAELELERGDAAAAIRIYDAAFRPLWPDDMSDSYFALLEREGKLREFSGRARAAALANPTDLDAAARLFHYFRKSGSPEAQRRVLLECRNARESRGQAWTPAELSTMAHLFERVPDANEAARMYYALYSAAGQTGPQVGEALYGLANLLLEHPEAPIHFGSGDLSFYQDIARTDSSPGFLNGILSLVLNGTGLRWVYEGENQKMQAYFHRAAGAQLVALYERRFPKDDRRALLRAKLVSAYAAHGDDDSVIAAGRAYLATFLSSRQRTAVAMQVAGALARRNREQEEFALYDQLLRELASRASGVPVGADANAAVPEPMPVRGLPAVAWRPPEAAPAPPAGRSPEYAEVLDRYLARLVGQNRQMDAWKVYRVEIDRNPNDPGLYARAAAFLEQNGMAQGVEEVYTRAIAKFNDRSWYDKLSRWYLRNRRSAEVEKIGRQAVEAFSGTELESYFADVVTHLHPDAALYLRLNQYAHQRFPEDLVFVRNLIGAYSRKETYDAAEAEHLLRRYWFYDPALRNRLFDKLSREGRLYPELGEVRKLTPDIAAGRFDAAMAANPAALEFAAEAETWLSHFEAAAPAVRSLAGAYPGRRKYVSRAGSLYRSLAAYDPANTAVAVALAETESRGAPRDRSILAKTGDIYADRELFAQARRFWDRMPGLTPANPEGYLEAATVFWDYYRFDDALRLIAAARVKFGDPALFAFQAGAIYEGKRDFPRAVDEYVKGALDEDGGARRRLVHLASRPATGSAVNRATAVLIARDNSWSAASVRIDVLEAQQRRDDVRALLEAHAASESAPATLDRIQEIARRQGFDSVVARAAERRIAVATDPVDRMRLTLGLVRLYETKGDLAAANRTAQALYRDHPEILGVVRGKADFELRTGQYAAAAATLLDAAKHARPDLAERFTLEAARAAIAGGSFEQARVILSPLLARDPYRVEWLTAAADSYLQAKDDRGFRDYLTAVIERLKAAPLAAPERTARIATLRRSLIPALIRMGDHAAASAQYMELINRYPEDEGLTREAATYATAHNQSAHMIAFYRKTIAAAPRDYRWPIVLGRIETAAEDYPAAIAAYEQALQARPDRADVLESKARLQERLLRFREALASYSRLYELTYRDPQWLIKAAEMQARLGEPAACASALETAIIGARTQTAEALFQIAAKLEEWHMVAEAVRYAERGAALAGGDLFGKPYGAVYARVMMRARRFETLIARLSPEPTEHLDFKRVAGQTAAELYSPEEKSRLEQALAAAGPGRGFVIAGAAGLVELEARWRLETMAAPAAPMDAAWAIMEFRRGLFRRTGMQLEEYAAHHAGRDFESRALVQAVQAYVAEGDVGSQMRVMRMLLERHAPSGPLLDRYLALLAERQPAELLDVIRRAPQEIGNRAVQLAIAGENRTLANQAVRARAAALSPLWAGAYTALAGVYYDDHSPAVSAAFDGVLDTRAIGERVRVRSDPRQSVAGPVWFYYAARYGEHLARAEDPGAEAFLPAPVEAAPASPDRHLALGDFFAERKRTADAIAYYENVLQLDSDRGDAHDHIARVLYDVGRKDEATGRWRAALDAFLRVQGRGVRVPEAFWRQVAETFADLGERHLIGRFRPEIERLLRDYVHRNAEYRLYDLLAPVARAAVASGEGTGWLMDLARALDYDNMGYILMRLPGLSPQHRAAIQWAIVADQERRASAALGTDREYRERQVRQARLTLVAMLLDAGDAAQAAAEWQRLRGAKREEGDQRDNQSDAVEIRLAARAGRLGPLLESYRTAADGGPRVEALRDAAISLRSHGETAGAQAVLEFLYERELRNGRLEMPNFLGLSEVKLERGDTAAAVAILRRMVLVTDDPFETLLPAAEVLQRFGRLAESVEFLRKRVTAVPWDAQARFQLGRASSGAERESLFAAVVTDPQAPYRQRAEAALAASPKPVNGTSGELALLGSGTVAPAAVAKPFFVEARLAAAGASADLELRAHLFREALSLDPADARARLGAIRCEIALKHDSPALALAEAAGERVETFDNPYSRGGRYRGRYTTASSVLPGIAMSDAERAAIAEGLASAAERLDGLGAAQVYLGAAIALLPPDRHPPLEARERAIAAELARRAFNASRQPIVKNVIEQDQVVRPRAPRSAR